MTSFNDVVYAMTYYTTWLWSDRVRELSFNDVLRCDSHRVKKSNYFILIWFAFAVAVFYLTLEILLKEPIERLYELGKSCWLGL